MGNDQAKIFHGAAKNGDIKAVQVLLHDKIDPDIRDQKPGCIVDDGVTPLHLAIKSGHLDVVQALLEYGANPNIKNTASGETPLHLALAISDFEICEILLQYGADVKAENSFGESCLQQILKTANGSLIRQVLKFNSAFEFSRAFAQHARKMGNPQLAQSEVNLLPTSVFLETEFFNLPSYKTCRDFLVKAQQVTQDDRILFVSHRWSNALEPDPGGIHCNMLRKFLKEKSYLKFRYVWIDYSCLNYSGFAKGDESDPRYVMKNMSNALLIATDLLILPAMTEEQPGIIFTDLSEFFQRGWCQMEFLLSILTGSVIHTAFCIYQQNFTEEEDGDLYFHWGEGPEFTRRVGVEASSYFREKFGYSPDLLAHENWVLAGESVHESDNMLWWCMLALEGLGHKKSKVWSMSISAADAGKRNWDPFIGVQTNPFWAALDRIGDLEMQEDRFTVLGIYFLIVSFCTEHTELHNANCIIS